MKLRWLASRPRRSGAGDESRGHLWLAVGSTTTHRAQLLRRQQMHRRAGSGSEHDVGLVSARTHELLDRRKAARHRHAHYEVQAVLDEQVDHEVAGIPAVEHEDVALAGAGQKVAQLRSLVTRTRADDGIDWHLGDDIEQDRDRSLRHVSIRRSAELVPKLRRALQGQLGSIDGQHAPSAHEMPSAMQPVELIGRVAQELSHRSGAKALACVAEGSRRDGLVDGQRHLIQSRVVPERVEDVLVAAPTAVSGNVHEKRDQELRRQRPATCEALAAELEFTCDGALDLRGYCFEGGTKFSPA